ncbi:hypothetical protein CHL67_06935 [Prosthecochloris sp. GSB1]|nr:hypothetical protein CHL67_06935 [Prosthecochloris sp. GSB1]
MIISFFGNELIAEKDGKDLRFCLFPFFSHFGPFFRKKSLIVYDATVRFCERFVSERGRTYDQMVQAAWSGKQNIIEGSQASGTSKRTEIRLTSVARAGLEELLEEWTKGHPYTKRLRELNRIPDADYETFARASSTRTRQSLQT